MRARRASARSGGRASPRASLGCARSPRSSPATASNTPGARTAQRHARGKRSRDPLGLPGRRGMAVERAASAASYSSGRPARTASEASRARDESLVDAVARERVDQPRSVADQQHARSRRPSAGRAHRQPVPAHLGERCPGRRRAREQAAPGGPQPRALRRASRRRRSSRDRPSERPSRTRPARRRARPTPCRGTGPGRERPRSRSPRARRRAECRRRARTRGRRRRSRRLRRAGTRPRRASRRRALSRVGRSRRARSRAAPSRNSAPAAAACSARKASSRRRWVMRMSGLLLLRSGRRGSRARSTKPSTTCSTTGETSHGSVVQRAAGEPAAAGLVAREARAVREQDARAAAREVDRRGRPGGPGADDENVESLHDRDRKHGATPGYNGPPSQGFPSGQRGRAVNPLAQPSEVRILPPALAREEPTVPPTGPPPSAAARLNRCGPPAGRSPAPVAEALRVDRCKATER